ncbi:DUF4142 domain-containing protein [Pedobacter sp. BS3]|uniref:DUF4142 domain-containing protein n=1 Tax=Pedobacter sp. BS3 TaxID=2567937 RepID=UPI0011EF5EC6|nr:DUF4142 domain-containing protein [Pedobacter sp. BS3]TZF83761.1 DUF4142 domain-containing protein [Pedobacter sp. BS3]
MKTTNLVIILTAALFQCCQNSGDKASSANNLSNGTALNRTDYSEESGADADSNDFIKKAADGGMLEVELGKLAQQKAASVRVKNFGTMMVTDHTKANNELKQIAQQHQVVVPSGLSPESKSHVDELGKLSGSQFDKNYINMMVTDHVKDIGLFENTGAKSRMNDLNQFAKKTLPTLKMHLDSAKAIQADISL